MVLSPYALESAGLHRQNRPEPRRLTLRLGGFLPQAEPACEGVGVVTGSAAGGKLFQLSNIPSPEHDIVGFERRGQTADHIGDIAAPLGFSPLLEPALPHVVFVGAF